MVGAENASAAEERRGRKFWESFMKDGDFGCTTTKE